MSAAISTGAGRAGTTLRAVTPGAGPPPPLISGRLAQALLFAWLGGVLVFGREFSRIGAEPIFLADLLAVLGALLSLPRWWPFAVRPGVRGLLLVNLAVGALTAQSVYRGALDGNPAALKSACMGVYPLVAVAVAGTVARDPDMVQRFARRVLPLVPLGFLVAALGTGFYIAAASGLYLAFASAWITAPGEVRPGRRGSAAAGTLLAVGYLAGVGVRRGPTIAILLAVAATLLATRRRRRRRREHQLLLAVIACFLIAAIAASSLALSSRDSRVQVSELPLFGGLAARVAGSLRPGTESGNNVALRLEMWRYALESTAEEHPLIGRGAGKPVATGLGLTAVVDERSGVHNSFVGYAFYSGFPSALLVVLALVLAIVGSWRRRSLPGHAPLLGATVAVVAICMTNVALETPYIAGPAWAVVGAAVGAAAARARVDPGRNRSEGQASALEASRQARFVLHR
jgi:hypothetical protein